MDERGLKRQITSLHFCHNLETLRHISILILEYLNEDINR